MATDTWQCDCIMAAMTPDHRPCRRVVANGTTHWGVWCRVCGAWRSRPKADVAGLECDVFTLEVREAFQQQRKQQWDEQCHFELEGWRAWYHGRYLHTPHWAALRAAVLERDPVCRGCGKMASVNAHHVTYHRLGCELLTDLVGMCRQCHARAHAHNVAMCPCGDCIRKRDGVRVPVGFRVNLG